MSAVRTGPLRAARRPRAGRVARGTAVPGPSATPSPAAERSTLQVLRRLLAVGAPAWGRFAGAIALGVAGAMATVGLLAGSGYVVDRAAFRPGLGAIAGILASVEVLAFLRGPLRYGERLVGHDVAFRSLSRWRVWLYDRLEPLAPAGLSGWRSGELLSRLTGDVDTLQDLYLRCLLPVAVTSATAVLAVALVAAVLPVAGAVLAGSLAVALVASPVLAVLTGTARGREAALRGALAAEVVDLLQSAPELVAYGQEHAALARAEALDRELERLARRRARAGGAAAAVVVACTGAAVTGVLAAGVAAVRAHAMGDVMLGVLPLAAVGAFETVPAVALAALRGSDVVAAGRRLLALAAAPAPVRDPRHPGPAPEGCPSVALDRARLRYGDELPWALDGLDLSIAPRERVGLVGASGAGKSSVLHALVRFWPLQGGKATLGGVPIDRLRQRDVRRAIALVDQDAYVFAGTIRHNVMLGRPDACDDDLTRALDLAHLSEWVATLPDGLDTQVGEGGAQVSGGQRRRIAIARALLSGGPVLALDEPTAGLDKATGERLVADVAEAAEAEGRSLLVVTHREDELAALDRVVVVESGRVVKR